MGKGKRIKRTNRYLQNIHIYSKSNLIQNYKSYNNICRKYANATGSTSGGGTAYLSGVPDFSPDVTLSLGLCVCFVDRCLSFCPFLLWSLCFLSFYFDYLWFIKALLCIECQKWIWWYRTNKVFLLKNTGPIFPLSIRITLMITTYKTALRRCEYIG